MTMKDFVRICSAGIQNEDNSMNEEDENVEFDDLLNEKENTSFQPVEWNSETFGNTFVPNGFGETVDDSPMKMNMNQLYQSSNDNEYEKFKQQLKEHENRLNNENNEIVNVEETNENKENEENENQNEMKEEKIEEVSQNPFKSKRVISKHTLIEKKETKIPKKTMKDRIEKEMKENKKEKKEAKIEKKENRRYSSLKEVEFVDENENLMNEMMNMTCFDDE